VYLLQSTWRIPLQRTVHDNLHLFEIEVYNNFGPSLLIRKCIQDKGSSVTVSNVMYIKSNQLSSFKKCSLIIIFHNDKFVIHAEWHFLPLYMEILALLWLHFDSSATDWLDRVKYNSKLNILFVWTVEYIEEENSLCHWFCKVSPFSSKYESMLFCMWKGVCLAQNIIFSFLNLYNDIYFVMWKLCYLGRRWKFCDVYVWHLEIKFCAVYKLDQ
jgi:hypothetical protein